MSIGIYDPPPILLGDEPPDPRDKMGLARSFIATNGGVHLLHEDRWMVWDGQRYVRIEAKRLEGEVYRWVESLEAFTPSGVIVRGIMMALAAILRTDLGTQMPGWLKAGDQLPDAENIISFANGLYDNASGEFAGHSPNWFSANVIPNAYDPSAECPTWNRFLDEIFEGDEERIQALAQWFGYNLTGDISQQTVTLLVGPPASGKSTTLRVLGEMLGSENVATPTLTTLWRFYGMETIHTKMAAIVGDAHLEGSSKATAILEKLKSVVGGDRQNIDLKGRTEIANVVVKARFTIAVNELPQLPDSAAALRRRMLVIPFNKSFEGGEDWGLDARLAAEMPGIVAWAMRGLMDLRSTGRLIRPKAGETILDNFTRLGSPIKEFLEDCCEVSPDHLIRTVTLYESWTEWCPTHGYRVTDEGRFGAMLKAAEPGIERTRSGRDERGVQKRYYRGVTQRRLVPRTDG